jgi:anti-anti-sigma regulatory factor
MTATITTSSFDCGRAQIRWHFRHLATVVTIHGEIDAVNVDSVIGHIRRLILARDPLVLDLSNVKSSAAECSSLVHLVAEHCRQAEVEWTLVARPDLSQMLHDSEGEAPCSIVGSVPEALQQFSEVIVRRRQLLLPLVRKSA